MATTITKRVSAAASGGNTRRVTGAQSTAYDCWAGSWGSSWAYSWFNFVSASELSSLTQRVPSGAAASVTKRVTGA